jgi:hypothetical protein
MHPELQRIAREAIKKNLAECSEAQQLVFKRMYSHNNLDVPINTVVDRMPDTRLDWALEQIISTVNKNEKLELDFLTRQDIVIPEMQINN